MCTCSKHLFYSITHQSYSSADKRRSCIKEREEVIVKVGGGKNVPISIIIHISLNIAIVTISDHWNVKLGYEYT